MSSESQPNIQVWQVDDKLLHTSLMRFPKVQSAVFPITSGAFGLEQQDVSVYRLLQVCSLSCRLPGLRILRFLIVSSISSEDFTDFVKM